MPIARYRGVCPVCGEGIAVGEQIQIKPGRHVSCSPTQHLQGSFPDGCSLHKSQTIAHVGDILLLDECCQTVVGVRREYDPRSKRHVFHLGIRPSSQTEIADYQQRQIDRQEIIDRSARRLKLYQLFAALQNRMEPDSSSPAGDWILLDKNDPSGPALLIAEQFVHLRTATAGPGRVPLAEDVFSLIHQALS